MLGFVSKSDKLKILKTADIYIATALFGENFGIVLLEAMAIPMCGYGNEGYHNVLSSSQQLFFHKPYHTENLTNKLDQLISNPHIREQMVDECRLVVKQYDWSILSKDIEKVYLSLL